MCIRDSLKKYIVMFILDFGVGICFYFNTLLMQEFNEAADSHIQIFRYFEMCIRDRKEILLLDDEHNELILPKTEQIPSDFFRKGEHVRAVVARVENKNNNPRIILSRDVYKRQPQRGYRCAGHGIGG